MTWRERIAERLFGDVIERRVALTTDEVNAEWWRQIGGATSSQDRNWHEIVSGLEDSLEAWRVSPLARRIVALTTDYVVGDGMRLRSEIPAVQEFIDALWGHPLNRLDQRLYAWSDELTRSGELFVVLSTNPGDGMSYVRTVPACRIYDIRTDPDDFERELSYHEMQDGTLEGHWWPALETCTGLDPVMLHFAVNRPVGCVRGEGDLVPLIAWLRRYREWLEDRVRVNRLRNSFVWHCKLSNAAPGDLERKRQQYRNPPSPGSIIVSDENEEWQALTASLQSSDAEADGKALRLLIAAGAGVPLHFLSEGESATRATAAEMGGPTFRHYRHRQKALVAMLTQLAEVAASRARVASRWSLPDDLQITCDLPELTRSDDLSSAQAMSAAATGLGEMVARGWLDDDAAGRVAARFAGGEM